MSIIIRRGVALEVKKIICARPTNMNLFGFKRIGIEIDYLHFSINAVLLGNGPNYSYPDIVRVNLKYCDLEERDLDLIEFEKISRANQYRCSE